MVGVAHHLGRLTEEFPAPQIAGGLLGVGVAPRAGHPGVHAVNRHLLGISQKRAPPDSPPRGQGPERNPVQGVHWDGRHVDRREALGGHRKRPAVRLNVVGRIVLGGFVRAICCSAVRSARQLAFWSVPRTTPS